MQTYKNPINLEPTKTIHLIKTFSSMVYHKNTFEILKIKFKTDTQQTINTIKY